MADWGQEQSKEKNISVATIGIQDRGFLVTLGVALLKLRVASG